MNYNLREYDDRGWAHIHHAAYRGYVKSLEKFIQMDKGLADFETGDSLHLTPLLIAVLAGRTDAVETLIRLGSKVNALDARGHGVIELAALGQNVEMLSYFLKASKNDDDGDDLGIWGRLLGLLDADPLDDEVGAVTACLRALIDPRGGYFDPNYRKSIRDENFLPVLISALRSTSSDDVREAILDVIALLLCVEGKAGDVGPRDRGSVVDGRGEGKTSDDGQRDKVSEDVREQSVECGLVSLLVRLLRSGPDRTPSVTRLSARILRDFCSSRELAEEAHGKGAIGALVSCLRLDATEVDTLVQVSEALGTLVDHSPKYQTDFTANPSSIDDLVTLYSQTIDRSLLLSLTSTIVRVVQSHRPNQLRFVEAGLAPCLVELLRGKSKGLQGAAVTAIQALAENNTDAQRLLKDQGVVGPLLETLTKLRQAGVQQTIARALWSIAGEDIEEVKEMSEKIGSKQLIEFLESSNEDLQLIGSEALGILSRFSGGTSSRREVPENAVPPLVRLLGSPRENIVLSVIRTLRYLSLRSGYSVQASNQSMIGQTRGLKLLVAIMATAESPLLRVEAAFSVACATLGNPENAEEIHRNPDFSYRSVIRMLNSPRHRPVMTGGMAVDSSTGGEEDSADVNDGDDGDEIRLLAGSALAAFAYNNAAGQRAIAREADGGLSFSRFLSFLRSPNDRQRCSAAFQVVVLSPIIHDAEPAIASAAGIRLMVDLLQMSTDDCVLAEACDCLARLAHTRVGIPGAIVSIDAIDYLCDLLLSSTEYVRSNASIALGYLSFNHKAKRQILARCRKSPMIMQVLRSYSINGKMSDDLLTQWKHFEEIGLPPIENGPNRTIAGNETKQHPKKRQHRGTTVRPAELSKSI